MDDIAGIDLGTTNSLIGIMESGFPVLLADADGERLLPSVVSFPKNAEPLVGRPATRARALHSAETIYSVKRLMGLRGDELAADNLAYRLRCSKAASVRIVIEDREFSPEEISALILRKLKTNAEAALGRQVNRAVITVPAYFNDAQRSATKRAGEIADITVERIINEPTAAALAYGLDKLGARAKIAVYDFGGGTFDISILELNEGVFEVLSTNGNTRLGGDDLDQALLASIDESRMTNAEAKARVLEALIQAKHQLSVEEKTSVDLPFLDGTTNFHLNLNRDDLEKISRPIVEMTRPYCLRALADAKLKPRDLDEVILVGGVTRMPLVREFVANLFEREPNVSQNPDEAVAIGATIQAGILSGAVRDVVLLDVTPLSLGIETFGGLMNVIIPRNSTIPVKAGEMFTTAVDYQRAMRLNVLQGEREMARDNWSLGKLELEFEAAPKGVARLGVQFEIDANGILHVLARDTKTGREKIVEINSAIDVSDEAVEAMIAESLDHAFDDMSERVWVEAKLKAEEMISALGQAFHSLGDEIDPKEKQEIEALASEVRAALASGESQRLNKATAALDKGTEPIAAMLVEHAMQANASTAIPK